MPGWSISEDANAALVKLLVKTGQITEQAAAEIPSLSDPQREGLLPIAWFSRRGHLSEDEAIAGVASKLHVPVSQIERAKHTSLIQLLQTKELSRIKLDRWQALRAIPIEIHDRHLMVAFANPLDHQAIKSLEQDLGKTIRPAIAREESILEVLGAHHSEVTDIDLASLIHKKSAPSNLDSAPHEELGSLEATLNSSDLSAPPIIRLVNKILTDAIQRHASDIHITPEKEQLNVKIRVDGLLQQLFAVPAANQNPVVSRLKLLAGMDIAEKRRPQDGRLRARMAGRVNDLRVSSVPTAYGESIVIRILSSDFARLSLDSIGADASTKAMIVEALKNSSRVVLVVGPTGSGKTSTLYGCLGVLNDGAHQLVTIEDPIEYRIEGINQIQVNPKIEVTFAEGLRSILRQDPDVIMVGEIRDAETASIAMQAAQTGHLVLSTLHTNSAAAAVTRLLDLGLPPYLIASSLGTIIAQRLVRKLCPSCSTVGSSFAPELIVQLGLDPKTIRQPKGCDLCGHTGYQGRTGIFSVLEVSEQVRSGIRDNKSEPELENLARAHGFSSLQESALEAASKGITSLEEVERALGSLEQYARGKTAEHSAPTLSHSAASSAPSTALGKRRVLLVEDDEHMRTVLSLLLQREMFEVQEASNGAEALEQIYKTAPEVVICDLMMPTMGGLEFVQRLRKDRRVRDIPVLMLTAATAEENELSSLTSGADDFVSKTSDSRVLLARLHRLLDR